MADDRDFDEHMITLRVCDDPDDHATTDVYMRRGTLREKAKKNGCTICELTFVEAGTSLSFLAPMKSMKQLARFIRDTVKDYEERDDSLGDTR